MASQKYYVNEYKGFFWSEGLFVCGVCVCVHMCICLFVCTHSIDPRKEEVNMSLYNTVHSKKIQKYNNYREASQEQSTPQQT